MRLLGPTNLRIFQNTILPHLPIEDNSLSLVTAFSVFTHIDDLDLAWIAELRRILSLADSSISPSIPSRPGKR